ncbi:MAG TPA: gamma carbonic anhydrase family protein [Thiothrix sp.]|nr:gamma carbonic anhydrase family protein [Thiothrix sp.]
MSIRAFRQYRPNIHPRAYIDQAAYVSGRTTIGADSSVWPMAVLRGDVQAITVGERSNVQDGAVLHVTHASEEYTSPTGGALVIGDDVTIGHNAVLHACTIGDQCLVGMGAIVLDGAILATQVMLAAGSLVPPNKVLESGYLWLGNPVKKARPLTDKEKNFLQYSAQHYVKLAQATRESAEEAMQGDY